jgi:hypothetical protein
MSAMRDPRNWARPVAAVLIGSVAGGALVLVRARQQQKKKQARGFKALERSVRGVAADLEKRVRRG